MAQTSGRQRLNIHGAIDLETGHTRMLEVETVDAASTIKLMIALLAMYPRKRVIHLFLDNASTIMRSWCRLGWRDPAAGSSSTSSRRDCRHLDPIERLWGLMHKHITHNKCHETFRDFSDAILTFLREEVPRNWRLYCDEVTDNFRIISSTDFRILVLGDLQTAIVRRPLPAGLGAECQEAWISKSCPTADRPCWSTTIPMF